MKRVLNSFILLIALVSLAAVVSAQTKKKPKVVDATPKVISEDGAPSDPVNAGDVLHAADIYKTSLKQLQDAREKEAERIEEQAEKLRELYKDGLVSKRELDAVELQLAEARHKVDETRKQLAATDAVVAESLADKSPDSVADYNQTPPARSALKKVAYIRYTGYVNWSASEISKIEKFFTSKFKRPLPIAAAGQSDLHDKWGYDHRNAVDVGVHPDSKEGLALMNFLSGQGIPFMAFRRAVPGSATGPHIHIGDPSQKRAAK